MKIAIISNSFPPVSEGGISTAHFQLFRALSGLKHDVKVFTFVDEVKTPANEVIKRHGAGPVLKKMIGILLTLVFRALGCNGAAYQLGDILKSCAALRINYDINRFNPQVVIFPDHGAPALYVKKPKKCKFVWISHHNPSRFANNSLIGPHCLLDTKLAIYLENVALRKVDLVICPSKYMLKVFKQTYRYSEKSCVIPNWIDQAHLAGIKLNDVRLKLELPKAAKIVYVPSAGNVLKGSDYVFEIARRLTAQFQGQIGFYFSGNLDRKLVAQLDLSVPKVAYFSPGRISYDENISYVKSCDLCVSPTLIESFGMALAEALSVGIAIVAFDVGGNSELVENGRNGFLAPLLDLETMIQYSLELLMGEKHREVLSNSEKLSPEHFSFERVVSKYVQVIGDL